MNKRHLLQSFLAASALSFGLPSAFAQATTPIKFQLDWRFEDRPRCSCIRPPRATSRPPAST